MILRGTPCEKKFDNSIIRDKKYISVTLRDIPCEKEKFDNSGHKERTVIIRGTPCEKEKFDNSIIRDIKKKTVIIRDHPCERKES